MTRSRHFLLLLLLLFLSGNCLAVQTKFKADLIKLLNSNPTEPAELDSLNKSYYRYFDISYPDSEAVSLARKVLELNTKAGYETGRAEALLNLGNACMGTSSHAEAMQHLFESYNIFSSKDDFYKMGQAQMFIGIAYYLMENYSKSIRHYAQAMNHFTNSGNLDKKSTLLYLMGIDYSGSGNYEMAQRSFFEALDLKIKENDDQGIAECRIQLATMFLDREKPDTALPYILPALEFAKQNWSTFGVALSKNLLARAYLQKQKPDSALVFASSALQSADSISSLLLIKDISYTLFQISKAIGNYKQAADYLEKFIVFKDSIFNDKNSRLISQLEAQQVITQKQNEILLLEKENKNRDLQLKGSIVIGLMFLLLFVVLYSRYVIRQRANRELETAYDNLRKTQEQLISHEKMASLGQLTAGIAHEIKNPLNFVNNFSAMSLELIEEFRNSKDESERLAILQDLSGNLDKISKHGLRADSIVKSMLDHSRTGIAEKSECDLNKLCSEYFNLSYQGIRAQYPLFSCELNIDLDPSIPPVNLAGQEISRVLINIFNNAFYATQKKLSENPGFKPSIFLYTRLTNENVVIRIRDNGTGIPKKVKDKIFEPFFTTKPTGEGTGLGLSISYEIITAHGGQMQVESEEGTFTEFTILLPVK